MKKLRWQLVIIFLTGLVVGILLYTQQPTVGEQPVEPVPTAGGIYTEGVIGSLVRLNPVLDVYNQADRDVNRLIFSSLIRFDSHGYAQADLAESWGISKDGTIYNFSLKPGVVWHDGKPLTSDDIIFTIEFLRAAEGVVPSDLVAFWKEVEVKQVNESMLQFRLPEAFSPFLDYLTFGVLPKHLLGDLSPQELMDAPFNLQPVGSGPYRFDHLIVENDQIQGIALTAFDRYYGEKPFIQQIVFQYFPDAEVAFQAYQQGEIQGISNVPPEILTQVLGEEGLSVFSARRPELALVLFNLKNPELPFLQETDVRRALMTGLNRQWMIDRLLNGQGFLADSPLFPGTWAYYDKLERFDYNPEEAISQLITAGYQIPAEGGDVRVKDGKPLAFKLLVPEDPGYKTIAEAIQKDWKILGVDVSLEYLPYDQLITERLDSRLYEAALVNLNLTRFADPDPYPFWDQAQAAGGQNYTQWDDKNASEYLEQARITLDLGERSRLYRNFQVLFIKELPALPLYYPVYTYAIDRQVQGVQLGAILDPSDRFSTVNQWYLVAKRNAEETAAPALDATAAGQ